MPLSVQRTSSARCASVVDASAIAFWKHDSIITLAYHTDRDYQSIVLK